MRAKLWDLFIGVTMVLLAAAVLVYIITGNIDHAVLDVALLILLVVTNR